MGLRTPELEHEKSTKEQEDMDDVRIPPKEQSAREELDSGEEED